MTTEDIFYKIDKNNLNKKDLELFLYLDGYINDRDDKGNTFLIRECIGWLNKNIIKLLLKNKINPNLRNNEGINAIYKICTHRIELSRTINIDIDILNLLLEYNAKPSINDIRNIFTKNEFNRIDIIRFLLKKIPFKNNLSKIKNKNKNFNYFLYKKDE